MVSMVAEVCILKGEIVFERLHKLRHLRRKCKYRRLTGLTDYDVVLSNYLNIDFLKGERN